MKPSTYEAISSRLRVLELQLGITIKESDSITERETVVARISRLHTKINSIYANNPEIQHVPDVMKRFQRPGDKTVSLIKYSVGNPENVSGEQGNEEANATSGAEPEIAPVDDLTKQELILIKHSQLVKFSDNLKELLTMEIPILTPEAYKGLDPSLVLERKYKIKAVAREFDLLLAKHLLILTKYSALRNSQSRFWKGVQDRLREATIATNAAVKANQLELKY